MTTLGERIKLLRGELTQKQFSEQLGIPATTLGNYENNKSELILRPLIDLKLFLR